MADEEGAPEFEALPALSDLPEFPEFPEASDFLDDSDLPLPGAPVPALLLEADSEAPAVQSPDLVPGTAPPSRDSRKLDCIICYCAFNLSERLPRRLYCGHTFCQACLRRLDTVLNEQMWIPCPQCRQNTPLPRAGATALDLDLAAFLGVKAELDTTGQRSSPRLAASSSQLEHKPSFGKHSIIEQPPGSNWAHGGLAEPRFHRSPCCRRCLLCCWWCC